MDEERDRQDRHPRPCPVCRVAMVAEDADDDTVEAFLCLNCGTQIILRAPGDDRAMG